MTNLGVLVWNVGVEKQYNIIVMQVNRNPNISLFAPDLSRRWYIFYTPSRFDPQKPVDAEAKVRQSGTKKYLCVLHVLANCCGTRGIKHFRTAVGK